MNGVEAVALDEKEVQRIRRRRGQRLAAGPGALELGRRRPGVCAGGGELDDGMFLLQPHACPEVWEP